MFERYGLWGVALGAFLPLREMYWAAWTFRMPLVPFLAALALGLAPKFLCLAMLSKALLRTPHLPATKAARPNSMSALSMRLSLPKVLRSGSPRSTQAA